jgi:hypothetical protein
VEAIRAGFGHESDLCTGRPAGISVGVGCRYPVFLRRIQRGPQNAGEGVSKGLVIIIKTIKRDVSLIGTSTSNRSQAAILGLGRIAGAVVVVEIQDSGLQKLRRSATFRESMGIASICALLIALPRVASLKLIVEEALTSTVCAVDPTVSLELRVAG